MQDMDEKELEESQDTIHPFQRVGLLLLLGVSIVVCVVAAVR